MSELNLEQLLSRRRKAIAYARTEPTYAVHDVRKLLEIVCEALVRACKVEVERSRKNKAGPPTLDELIAAIEKAQVVPGRVAKRMRLLQAAGNYAAHAQADGPDLSPESALDYVGNLDALLREVLGVLADAFEGVGELDRADKCRTARETLLREASSVQPGGAAEARRVSSAASRRQLAACGGAVLVLGTALAIWSVAKMSGPPPCQAVADVAWAGWNCSPAKAEVMVHGCADTRTLGWFTGELRRLNEAGSLQLPFQPFKLVPSLPDEDGRIAQLWFCPTTDSDEECRGRRDKHLPWHNLSVGQETAQGKAIRLNHGSAGFSSRAVYLDKAGEVWCEYQAPKMIAISLP